MELISRLICTHILGYRLSVDLESDEGFLLLDKSGNWDFWRTTSRWTKLLFWHLRQAMRGLARSGSGE